MTALLFVKPCIKLIVVKWLENKVSCISLLSVTIWVEYSLKRDCCWTLFRQPHADPGNEFRKIVSKRQTKVLLGTTLTLTLDRLCY